MYMQRYEEKRIKRYVIASFDSPTLYLYRLPGCSDQYAFTQNIDYAVKTVNQTDALLIKNDYLCQNGIQLDLVVLPINIVYELINEDDICKTYEQENH